MIERKLVTIRERNFLYSTLLAVSTSVNILWLCEGIQTHNNIPNASEVQDGYAIPSKLEIELADKDRNGLDETYLHYDGMPYLLKVEDGKPVIRGYEVKPAEIVEK